MTAISKEGSGHATCPSEPEGGSGESNTGLLLSCQRNESTFMSLKTDPPEGKFTATVEVPLSLTGRKWLSNVGEQEH